MSSGHDHSHGSGHDHAPEVTARNVRAVGFAAALTGGFMLAEVAGGLVSGSLALLADAGHMLTDFAALALAWFAFRLARRPADWKRTYGFDRFSVLVAFTSGLSLFVIAAFICWEAVQRLQAPVPVAGDIMVVIAVLGFIVNIGAFFVLRTGDRENLNIRAASLHVLGDLLGSAAAIVGALVIILTGWTPIDPLLSVLVALIILRGAVTVTRDSAHILLEAAPPGLEGDRVIADLERHIDGVARIHHVHAWSISKRRPMITLHAVPLQSAEAQAVREDIRARLRGEFHVEHATIELEDSEASSEGGASKGCH